MSLIEQKKLIYQPFVRSFILYYIVLYYIILYCAQTWTLKSQHTSKLLSDTVRAYMDVGNNAFEVTEANR
jgi:hypothetical protein